MKPIKTIMEFLITGCVCTALLILPMTLKTEAETEPSSPCAGVGRIARIEEETTNYTPETETPEIEPYIAPQAIIETEAVSASYRQVTGKLNDDTEEFVEVFPEADPIIETDIDALIVQVAAEYGLPWQLVRAVVWAESTFDPYAVSDHPDYGLMQVWEQIWIDYGYDPKDPIVYDPETNLRMGCQVLKQKIDAHDGDFANALTCYRFGDGGALAMWSRGEWSNWYTEDVLGKYYQILREG